MKKKIIFLGIVLMLITVTTICVFASSGYTMTYYSGTSDVVTNLPNPDDAINGEKYTVSSQIPEREGYEFLGWVLDYEEIKYTVEYVIESNEMYGKPSDVSIPIDLNKYSSGEIVHVAEQLSSTQDYAYFKGNVKLKISGSWTFEKWDHDDFEISDNTTITGTWKFTPDKHFYVVYYSLWDGKNITKDVHDPKIEYIDSLGIQVTEYAIPLSDLKKPYSVKKNNKYQYYIVTPYQEKVISKDGYIIYLLYAKIPKGQ